MAYRGVIREEHARETNVRILEKIGKELPDLVTEEDRPAFTELVQQFVCFEEYKADFDAIFLRGDPRKRWWKKWIKIVPELEFFHIPFPLTDPLLVASSSFEPIFNDTRDVKGVVMNVFSSNNTGHLIFAYKSKHALIFREWFSQRFTELKFPNDTFLTELSSVLLDHCEIFVFAPAHFSTFTPATKKRVLEIWSPTLHQPIKKALNINLFAKNCGL